MGDLGGWILKKVAQPPCVLCWLSCPECFVLIKFHKNVWDWYNYHLYCTDKGTKTWWSDYPGGMNNRKSRDSHAISQLKSRALFPATTITVVSDDISGLSGFTEWLAAHPNTLFFLNWASCPVPDTTRTLEGGLEGWLKELQRFTMLPPGSLPQTLYCYSPVQVQGLLWRWALRDWVW